MHGGTVEARERRAGRGSEFVVRLPVVVEAAGRPRRPAADEPAGPAPSRRILVVDDNRDRPDSLALLLRCMGHDARTAYDGGEAVDGGRGVPSRGDAARHRPAGAQRLRRGPRASASSPGARTSLIVA